MTPFTDDERIKQRVLLAMIDYYAGDPARIQHFIKVHAFARTIGLHEGLDARTQYVLELSALVHDIGIKPAEATYGSSMGKYQEQLGPQPARELLSACGVDDAAIERICYLVAHHHTYSCIEGLDYQILVEADFIVNIYEGAKPQQVAISVRNKIFKTSCGRQILSKSFGLV